MNSKKAYRLYFVLLYCLGMASINSPLAAEEIHAAVASNFKHTISKIAKRFQSDTGHKVVLIFGSTGKHYAQIINRAPFDVFFAADKQRPKLLEHKGFAIPGSRFTYALGQLVLWSPKPGYIDAQASVLAHGQFRFLAIANPKLAPYGLAAQETLQAHGLWGRLSKQLVRGENISQAFQFVNSGNAELGFVAHSQIKTHLHANTGSIWKVPQTLYQPIEQQAVLLRNNNTSRAFLAFVRSKNSLNIIRESGYDTP